MTSVGGPVAWSGLGALPPVAALLRPVRVWGGGIAETHDLAWASLGIEVVRAGCARRGGEGEAALYLLLRERQLVNMPLEPVLRRLHWLSPELLRVRLIDRDPVSYRERVRSTAGGAFAGIERHYGARSRGTGQAWFTSRREIAERWAAAADGAAAQNEMRRLSGDVRSAPVAVRGVVADAECESAERWLRVALETWLRQDAIYDGVYEFAEGVWVHETAEIDPTARLVGPLWVGAGVEIGAGEVVVGPRVLHDRREVAAPRREIDWREMRSRVWSLPSWRSRSNVRAFVKRVFDIVFSLAVLVATAPVYPLAMLAIYLEDGRPFFFAHRRQTRGGRDFPCLKFRTMVKDAEKIKEQIREQNEADGPQFFMEDDPRLLRVGRVLRKYQIDELPQFLNVLRGDMSVVGPRPSPDKENQYCPTWREARLSVRPGITGLWQVRRTRAPETDFQEWIKYDLEYVRHQSLWRDMAIIAATAASMIKG